MTGLACATIVTSFASIHKKMIRDDIDYKTSIYIGMLASELGSEDYEHKRNLVSQNTYNIDNTVSYNTANIAKDIMSVCENDDSLFDLCLFDVYFNLNYDRLANMDGIFYGLKVEMKSLDENNPLHTKLNDYKSFLEYAFNTAVSNGYLEVGSKDYKEILNAVNNYHQYHFNELSDSDQKAIRELLDHIKEIKTNMGNTKLDELSKLVTDREINSKKGEGRGA